MRKPIVSVVVPFHNAAEFLTDALESLSAQSLVAFECVMIDDASTDASEAIAKRFANSDPRFKLLSNRKRKGVSEGRNAAFAVAEGEWVALLDADDLFVPNRLERLTAIAQEEGADMIFDDQIVTEYPHRMSKLRAFGFNAGRIDFSQEDFFKESRLFRRSFPVGYMKPLIRRTFLSSSGVSYDPNVSSGEDFLFYAKLFSKRPKCIATSHAGYIYRRRRGSLSRSDEHLHFHAGLSDRVLKDFGQDLSPQSQAALAARRGNFEDIADALPALSAWRDRRVMRTLAILMARPRVAVTGLRLLRTRLSRKFSEIAP